MLINPFKRRENSSEIHESCLHSFILILGFSSKESVPSSELINTTDKLQRITVASEMLK